MVTTISLGGHLGRKFGRSWRLDLDVPSPAEAVRALCAVCEGFKAWVLQHHRPGYHVFVGRKSLREAKELGHPTGSGDIHIMPALAGAKSGWVGVILGGVLIAAGVAATIWSGGIASPLGAALVKAGGGLALSAGLGLAYQGVSTLLAGQPPPGPKDGPDKSYVFSGPVNTTGAGHPVPVIYGKLEVGSQVISAAITQRRVAAPNPVAYDDPTPYPAPTGWHSPKPIDP